MEKQIWLATQLFDKTQAGTDALWTPGGGGGSSSDPQIWNSPGYPSFNWAKFTEAYTYFDEEYGMTGVGIVASKKNVVVAATNLPMLKIEAGETSGGLFDRNPKQDKLLTPGEIKRLKDAGWDHSDKGNGGGKIDL